jgi:hypothetical protein
MSTARQLFREALAEDKREGSRFDPIGFCQFFPEEHPETIRNAWELYLIWHVNRVNKEAETIEKAAFKAIKKATPLRAPPVTGEHDRG